MSVALRLYEQLTEAPDEKSRARAIAEALEQLEDRYPQIRDVATAPQLRETELRLQKEIERVRLEIKETELRLQKEIEQVRLEIREVESKLRKEIEQVRLEIREVESKLRKEIEQVRLEIREVESKLQKEIREVESRLQKDIRQIDVKIEKTRSDLVRWVVGVGLLQSSLIIGVLLKIAHLI
jgi:chromosome segregation ATPase